MTDNIVSKIQNTLSIKIINKFLMLISVGFPGGYKFFIVLLITTFATNSVATDFSIIFFWIALLVTFTGLPIASLMVAPQFIISTQHKLLLIIISSFISFSIAYYVELNQYSHANNFFIYLSIICLSSYEVLKRYFLNDGDFKSLFIASCFTMILVIPLFLGLLLLESYSVGLLLVVCFISLVLPLLYLQIIKVKLYKKNVSSFYEVLLGFIKYSLSNGASTSLLFALPIILIAEMGEVIATDLAQVFYFTSLTYLIPHALSAKHIPNMRQHGIKNKDIKFFFTSILTFVITVCVISLPVLQYLYHEWAVYFMLLVAMQISQLSIPFSNILMVKGETSRILKINIIASTALFFVIIIIMNQMVVSDTRAKAMLLSFIGFQVVKLLLNIFNSNEFINKTDQFPDNNEY